MDNHNVLLEKLNSTERAMLLQFSQVHSELRDIKETLRTNTTDIDASDKVLQKHSIRLTKLESSARTANRLGWTSISLVLAYIFKLLFEHKL